jgi:hypothetical protein
MAEEDLAVRVAEIGLAQGDVESAQGLGEGEVASAIGEPALLLNLAHLETERVLDGRQAVGKREWSSSTVSGWQRLRLSKGNGP